MATIPSLLQLMDEWKVPRHAKLPMQLDLFHLTLRKAKEKKRYMCNWQKRQEEQCATRDSETACVLNTLEVNSKILEGNNGVTSVCMCKQYQHSINFYISSDYT